MYTLYKIAENPGIRIDILLKCVVSDNRNAGDVQMTENNMSKEAQILQVMKRVLTDVARDTYTKPGLKHPLSEDTIHSIRNCLGLISAREQELAKAEGRPMDKRPRYVDEPQKSVVVDISGLTKNKSDADSE